MAKATGAEPPRWIKPQLTRLVEAAAHALGRWSACGVPV